MNELVCHFHDYLSDLSVAEKYDILKAADVEVIRGMEAVRIADRKQVQLPRDSYRQLVLDLQAVFGESSSTALAALIAVGLDSAFAQRISESAWKAISTAHEFGSEVRSRISTWSLEPDNWFLIRSEQSPFTLQSRISAAFPCLLFEDGPVECAGAGDPEVALRNIDEIVQTTGIDQLWANGNLGEQGTVCILDTGITNRLLGTVTASTVVGPNAEDLDGHGTAICDLIRTLCPKANIRVIRVLEQFSDGGIWHVLEGLMQLNSSSSFVVNLSLGVTPGFVAGLGAQAASFRQTISYVLEGLGAKGHFPISAAGNDGRPSLRWPAASPRTLAVGAHNSVLRRSSFSNYQVDGQNMVLAPGGERIDGRTQGFGRYGFGLAREVYGTSFSTAVASSLACLLMSFDWFARMDTPSRISLFRNHCRRNPDGFPLLNVADIGAVWPIGGRNPFA